MKRNVCLLVLTLGATLLFSCSKENGENQGKDLGVSGNVEAVVKERMKLLDAFEKLSLKEKRGLLVNPESVSEKTLELFVVNGDVVTKKMEDSYASFWEGISLLSSNRNIALINDYIDDAIRKVNKSDDFDEKQKELLWVEFASAKEIVNRNYKKYLFGRKKPSLIVRSVGGGTLDFYDENEEEVINQKMDFWCGLALVGNGVATIGLASCLPTGGGGCAAAVVGKLISFVSIYGSCVD